MEPNLNSQYSLSKIYLLDDYVINHIDKNAKIHHNLIKKSSEKYYLTFWLNENSALVYKKFYHHFHNNKLYKTIEYNKSGDEVLIKIDY